MDKPQRQINIFKRINVTMAVSLVGKGRQAFALSKLVWFTLPKDDNPNGRETNLKYTSLRKEEE